ncbi:hypothetical protein SISSUDRAFT_1044449 [Sistotremastrum suecicum HHB10207 ss-3]|uniref:Uncharacterized protein n=1 Tax=Sistotremastrum suecicum HHB10207 ss-3 TaxID=1314776 RepID=A0A166F2X2_9AGAM|nr:hypothetical protein SISSUDRAFT_1044449 [Sistotremastrum suecicum HHB10207 ss-3]
MTTQLTPLSASVTRILSLSGFSPVLKTKDVQQAFSEWENASGGFRIKWLDDTSLYIVFQDAGIAKRAYLSALASPPAILSSPTSDTPALIRPYDGPDAQSVIQAVNARSQLPSSSSNNGVNLGRSHSHGHGSGHVSRASIAVGGGANGAHARFGSISGRYGPGGNGGGVGASPVDVMSPSSTLPSIPPNLSFVPSYTGSGGNGGGNGGREPSPTLPSLPSQPTLDALINSSLSGSSTPTTVAPSSTLNTTSTSNNPNASADSEPPVQTGPNLRMGDPARRMVAHSLGVRHPGLVQRRHSGEDVSTGRASSLTAGGGVGGGVGVGGSPLAGVEGALGRLTVED